jgi:thiosulfate reductase/polysulfide reductase chain A
MKAYTQDGVLLKLEGNPDCQVSRGRLCGKGQSAIEMLYDPDRLKYPLKRTNPEKGRGIDPKWQRISWEEAYDIIAEKFSSAIEKSGAHSILYLGKYAGFNLPKILGTPNIVSHNATCDIMEQHVYNLTIGSNITYDLSKSKYLLAFGYDKPGEGKNVYTQRFAEFMERKGTKAVIVDPRLTATASKADEWIPIKPAGDLAFSLAMLNTIIKENLYDKDYVEKYTAGFDEIAEAVKDYTPEWAEKISEVPAETIVRIAREFATTKPAVIPMNKRGVYNIRRQGFSLIQTHMIMMAITGNIEVEGGFTIRRTLSLGSVRSKKRQPTPKMKKKLDGSENKAFSSRTKSWGMMQTLPDAILSKKPYPIECMIVYYQGLYSFSNTPKAEKALREIPFLVNINMIPDEMAMLADIVLPATTFLEDNAIVQPSLIGPNPQITARQAVVKPLHEVKPVDEIYQGIAKKMGLEDYLPPSGISTLNKQLKPLGITFEDLKKMGVLIKEEPFKAKDLTQLNTSSGKLELSWDSMKKHNFPNVPHYRDEYELHSDGEYKFYITNKHGPLNRHNTTCNISWIHEAYPENKLQMNASRAAEMGIKDDDWVRIESKIGIVTMKVDLTEGIRPDTVCIPHGFGHWATALSKACGYGANDGDILPLRSTQEMIKANDPSGNAAECDIMVKVYKA